MFPATLESVLEYNARAEFADKTMNDEAIKLRIANARKGLSDAAIALRNMPEFDQSDSGIRGLTASLQSLRTNLEAFNESRDTEVWAKQVEDEQRKILANRQQFWDTQLNRLFKELSDINLQLSEVESKLRS